MSPKAMPGRHGEVVAECSVSLQDALRQTGAPTGNGVAVT